MVEGGKEREKGEKKKGNKRLRGTHRWGLGMVFVEKEMLIIGTVIMEWCRDKK